MEAVCVCGSEGFGGDIVVQLSIVKNYESVALC